MAFYRISPRALEDLREIATFKEEYSNRAAVQFLDGMIERFQRLSQFPKMGKMRSELSARLRSFPVDDYLIFYRMIDGGVEIVRVVSGYRDLEALFSEKDEM